MAAEPGNVTVFAPGKINLYLRVGAVIPELDPKKHRLLTVFQCLDLGETLRLFSLDTRNLQPVETPKKQPIIDEVETTLAPGLTAKNRLDTPDNLVYKALAALRQTSGIDFPPTRVEVYKRIPIAGGMAGGSADAAGTIVGVNRLYNLGLSMSQQIGIAAQLGADVPALLVGGNALGKRFGDVLTPLLASTKRHWVLVISETGLSTPEVFHELDRNNSRLAALPEELPQAFVAALDASPRELAAQLVNDLEAPALSLRPELRALKQAAIESGALAALISGSGPTIACLCEDANAAEQVYAKLRNNPLVKLAIKTSGPENIANS